MKILALAGSNSPQSINKDLAAYAAQLSGLPFTLLFDANGSIFDSILGQVEPTDLRQRIGRLVAKSKT